VGRACAFPSASWSNWAPNKLMVAACHVEIKEAADKIRMVIQVQMMRKGIFSHVAFNELSKTRK